MSDMELRDALRGLVEATARCGCDNDQHAHYCHEARERIRALVAASDLTICPQCVAGAHDKCLTNPEEGMECFCPDPSHATPAPGAGEQRKGEE